MSDVTTSRKLELRGGGTLFGTADAVWVQGYLRFEPAHKYEMRGPFVYVLIVNVISRVSFKCSHSVFNWTTWNFLLRHC